MAVSLQTLPEALRGRVGPDAPAPMRMMVARALVPMGPEDLFTALAFLASNEKGELGETAERSLGDIPTSVVKGVVGSTNSSDLLDFAIRHYVQEPELISPILLNTSIEDDSLAWAARTIDARFIELIANNQMRIARSPKLVEAIYYNPKSPMSIVTRVFETAVRSGLRLNHIPGYREIYASIFGKEAVQEEEAAKRTAEAEAEAEAEATTENEAEVEVPVVAEVEEVLDDDTFAEALVEAAKQETDQAESEDEQQAMRQSMHAMIEEMSVPQKVRLALVGNATARNILIKDGKQIVARSVLMNPQLTEKEIAAWSKNKAIPEVIIQTICRNREWTKNTNIQLALIQHPKTPAVAINRWIKVLNKHKLKQLSKSRDVPAYVSRLAKNILTQRENSR